MASSQSIDLVIADSDIELSVAVAYLLNSMVDAFNRCALLPLPLRARVLTRRILPFYMPEISKSRWVPTARVSRGRSRLTDSYLVTLRESSYLLPAISDFNFQPRAVSLGELVSRCSSMKNCCETHRQRVDCLKSLSRPMRIGQAPEEVNPEDRLSVFFRSAELVKELVEIWGTANAEFLTSREGQ